MACIVSLECGEHSENEKELKRRQKGAKKELKSRKKEPK